MADPCKISVAIVGVTEKRSHVIKIDRYSRTKEELDNGDYVRSPPFNVGGHSWVMEYYPNGSEYTGFISVYLVLDSADTKDVKAKVKMSLLDKDGASVPSCSYTIPLHTFTREDPDWGYCDFIETGVLEAEPEYLRDDCFSIRCDVTVMKEKTSREEAKGDKYVVVSPSDLHRHLGDLLKSMDGADVTFQVGGEMFPAHRSVLAARSSVFKAELLGAMKENAVSPIKIIDMESEVFKFLLHFIYTDSLPEMTGESSNEDVVMMSGHCMASHLLVAADRYNIERLKLMCEHKLCEQVDTDKVANSLALAEQHSCHGLEEACFEFLASPSTLEATIASDGYEHPKRSCPSVLKELVARLLPAELKAAKDIIMAI